MKKALVLFLLAFIAMPEALLAQYRGQNYSSYDYYYERRTPPQPALTADVGLGIYERDMYGYGVRQQYSSRQRMPQYQNNRYTNRYTEQYNQRYPRTYGQRYPQHYGNRSGNIIIQVPRIIIGKKRCY